MLVKYIKFIPYSSRLPNEFLSTENNSADADVETDAIKPNDGINLVLSNLL